METNIAWLEIRFWLIAPNMTLKFILLIRIRLDVSIFL